MKTSSLPRFLFLGALLVSTRLLAVTAVPYTEGVSFSFRISGVGNGIMTVYGEGTAALGQTTSGTITESAMGLALLRPGKKYAVNFQASGPGEFWLSYIAPDGYELLVNDLPRDLVYQYTGGGWYSYDYTVELSPVGRGGQAGAGVFSGIQLGKSVTWDVGLGGLRTGRGAGLISFKEYDLTNNPANRQRLFYAAPSNYVQITSVYDGASGQTLRQVKTPQVLVDIVDLTGDPNAGYTLKFYDPAQGTWNGTLYTLSGSPWRTIKVEQPAATQLKLTETEGSVVRVSFLTLTSGSVASGAYVWTLQEGDGSTWLRTTTHTSDVPTAGVRHDLVEVKNAAGTVATSIQYRYENYGGWGEELRRVIAGSGSLVITHYTYYTDSTQPGNYRRLKTIEEGTGNWVGYSYYDTWDYRGQLFYEYHPWLSSPSTPTLNTTITRVFAHDYTLDWTGRRRILLNRQEYNNNVLAGLTYNTPTLNQSTLGQYYTSYQADAYASASAYQRSVSEVMDVRYGNNPDYNGLVWSVKRPDSSQDSYAHYQGSYNPGTKVFTFGGGSVSDYYFRSIVWHGSTSATGAIGFNGYDGIPFTLVYLIANKSTMDVTIRNPAGLVVRTETHVHTGGSSFSLLASEDFTYDSAGRLTSRVASNGATVTNTITNGRLVSTVGVDGTETQFTYDLLGRVVSTIKKGAAASGSYAAQGDITSTTTYDGANRVTQTVTSGGALSQTATAVYDLAGRMTSSVAPGGYTTGLAYTSGGKITTATLPGGATKISEVYLDGQAKQITGTAVVAQYFGYSVNGTTGQVTRQVNNGTSTSTNLVQTTADWLGRAITETRPAWSGTFTSTFTYNSLGQLTKRSQPGLADTLYVYDTLGGLVREGLDLNANGTLDLVGSDRVTDQAWSFVNSSGWWLTKTTSTYATTGNGTATQVSKSEQRVDLPANRLAHTKSTDIFGNVTVQFTDVNRAGKLVTTTTDAPDSTTDAVSVAYNGLGVSSKDTTGLTMTAGYDALGRPVTSVDPRTGTTTTAYVSGTSQVLSVTDPASIVQASYTYDSAGRVATSTNALSKVCRYDYTARNEKFRVWGDTDYPVEYGYDAWGRQTTMKTYRAGTGWNGTTWPASPGTADTTTWNFQEATGLLSSKTDAASKSVSYTYTQPGQIATRTWARGTVTTYAYSSTTAELTGVTYSDSTPAVDLQFNRLGQLTVATQTSSGGLVTTLDPCLCGKLLAEIPDATFFGNRRIDYQLHATADGTKGRTDGYTLKVGATTEQTLVYGYDTTGRFNALTADSTAFTYAYTANSNLIASITQSSANWTQTRAYLSNRNLLDVVETKISTNSKAKFDYAHDNLGRFTSVAKTGEVFARYGNTTQGLDTTWTYNDRSELTSEQTKLGGSATVLTGRDDAYTWDNIGNRTSSPGTTHNGNTAAYTTNALNQYTSRTVPGIFDVAGGAASAATVTVNGSSTGVTRHGDYFFKGQSMANSPNTIFSTLAVSDGTTTTNLPAFVQGTPEAMTYDDDGNLLTDGRWTRTYDAESRLIAMETTAAAYGAGVTRQKVEFRPDVFGRRVGKKVYHYASGWVLDSERRFVYDGWNMIEELDVSGATITKLRTNAWGLDLSGSRQGAGGVGGLLLVQEAGNAYLPVFDGNGNVHGLIKASDGSLAAAYEFDAFGNTLRESGTYAASNPFRFSTKYTDVETGEVNYGMRMYSPTLGRFTNRDPIGEQGGLNLYAFVGNNGVNKWDYLGRVDNTTIGVDGDEIVWVSKGRAWNAGDVTVMGIGSPSIAGDDFSASGIREHKAYMAAQRDQAAREAQGLINNPSAILTQYGTGKPEFVDFTDADGNVSTKSFSSFSDAAQQTLMGYLNVAVNAMIANHVYGKGGALPSFIHTVTGDGLTSLGLQNAVFNDARTGFASGLYQHSGTGAYTLAYRGTEPSSFKDWFADAAQAFGFRTPQYEQAITLAGVVSRATNGNLSYTGHSLGGGEASAAAIVTNLPAITFNAAGLSRNTVARHGADLSNAENLIQAYYVQGDIVSLGQDLTPFIFPSAAGTRRPLAPTIFTDPVHLHLMNQVTKSIGQDHN